MSAWFELQKKLDDYAFKYSLSYQLSTKSDSQLWSFRVFYRGNAIVNVRDCDNLFQVLYYGLNALKNKFGGNFDINVGPDDLIEDRG